MRIAVIGANGQLGIDLCQAFREAGHEVKELDHSTLDITDNKAVLETLGSLGPELVVNTAAMHNVDACEADPAQSFAVNGIGARNLALAANMHKFLLCHLSSDYVFDGTKGAPYLENDPPLPLNVYGNTKLCGEFFVRTIAERYFIVRVSGLYGKNLCRAKGGLNFVSLMLKLAKERDEIRVVNDEFVSPTFTEDAARQIVHLAGSKQNGIYHATSQGGCSWYEFAAKIFELTNTQIKLTPAAPGEFPAKVPRPKYSVLENAALKSAGLDIMPHWQDGLKRYLGLAY